MAKMAKFRLVLDIDYELNGENKEALKEILFNIPDYLANRKLLTNESPAVVDRWVWTVKQRK